MSSLLLGSGKLPTFPQPLRRLIQKQIQIHHSIRLWKCGQLASAAYSSSILIPLLIRLTIFLTFTTTPGPIHISRGGSRCTCPFPWYIAELLDWCHEHGYQFSVTADKDQAVKELIAQVAESQWVELEPEAEPREGHTPLRQWAHETVHTLNDSQYAYRIILLRRERRQPDLLEGAYTYGAIITNMQMPLAAQIRWHRERCNSENHHKELKHGLSLRVLPSGEFAVNAVWFRIGTLAYNLIAALKHLKLDESWRYLTIKTIRFRLLRIPALVVRHARTLWLRAPRGHPYLATLRASLA